MVWYYDLMWHDVLLGLFYYLMGRSGEYLACHWPTRLRFRRKP